MKLQIMKKEMKHNMLPMPMFSAQSGLWFGCYVGRVVVPTGGSVAQVVVPTVALHLCCTGSGSYCG